MVTTNAPTPILPAPPRATDTYTPDWANQLNRWLQQLYLYLTGFIYLRASGLYFPGISDHGWGLRTGEVFSNRGVLTIVRDNDVWIEPVSAAGAVGTLTVTP